MELERKTFCLDEAKLLGNENTLAGYGSVFGNEDLQGDAVDAGAFDKTLKSWLKNGFLAWMHKWDVPIGYPIKAKSDDHGLNFEAEFHSTPDAVMAKTITRERLAAGKTMGLSIGYQAVSDGYENGVRHIKALDLYEVSLVSVPANPLALTTGLKSVVPMQDLPIGDRAAPWAAAEAEKRVREWADAQGGPNGRYARAFVIIDGNPDTFASYKLQIADVVDGKLTVLPRAVFAAAGAIQGARGGVDAEPKDLAGAKSVLEKWYAKMATEFHDEDIVAPWKSQAFFTGSREFMTALIVEAEALAARRAKEGREFSAANVLKLTSVREQLVQATELLTAVLADKSAGAPLPDDLAARARRLRLAV